MVEGGVTSDSPVKAAILLVLALLFLHAGCEKDQETGKPQSEGGIRQPVSVIHQEPKQVIVTSDDDSLPDGCHPRQVAGLVISFVNAFNSGDQASLSRIFFVSEGPSPPDFADRSYDPWSWYTVGKVDREGRIESSFVTYDQGELLRYFAKRHRKGEQLRLIKIRLTRTGLLGKEDNVGFLYVLNRTARDLEPGLGGPAHIASGQGTINCPNRRIFAWRMDMKAEDERTAREAADWLCTDPPGWKPGKAVVACT